MEQILVYGDSLTWGIIPNTRERLEFGNRWPGVMENLLNRDVNHVRVIEDCLNGRRTVFEDPFRAGRNGLVGLAQRIEANSPLSLIILALGTNDFQSVHPHTAWHAAQGIATLIQTIRLAPVEPGMTIPPILVMCPPPVKEAKGQIAPKFKDSNRKCIGIAEEVQKVTDELNTEFFDVASATEASDIDGVHLDKDQHLKLGNAVTLKVKLILNWH
ncbi:MAG: SGNH/GDSL hydrolase family protein [Proteobacteria bacterium]|nr:SGNH/GDSL hydrolase family protein [Pseudomonadota bacterium]